MEVSETLVRQRILTTAELRAAGGADQLEPARTAWCAIPGQRSGVTWNNLLKLAGMPATSAGRLVVEYVTRAVGVRPPERVADLVREVADEAGWHAGQLDHAIWRHESGQRVQPAG